MSREAPESGQTRTTGHLTQPSTPRQPTPLGSHRIQPLLQKGVFIWGWEPSCEWLASAPLPRTFFLLECHGWPCSGVLTASSVTDCFCRCCCSLPSCVTGCDPKLRMMFVSQTRSLLYPSECSVPTAVPDIHLAFNKYCSEEWREGGVKGRGGRIPKGFVSFRFTDSR